MTNAKFDVYKLALEDTNQINSRRQGIDTLFMTIITLILSGDVYVALLSRFDNWLAVAVTGSVGVVGIIMVARWNQARGELDGILRIRYEYLRQLEQEPEVASVGSNFITEEYNAVYRNREATFYRSATARLARTFVAVFISIPVLLGILTLAHVSPIVAQTLPWLHELAQPLGSTH